MRRNYSMAMAALCGGMAFWLAMGQARNPERIINAEEWLEKLNNLNNVSSGGDTSPALSLSFVASEEPAQIIGTSFNDLYPAPTATPTPTPRPPAPLNIGDILKRHSLVGMVGDVVFLYHMRTKEDIVLKVGESLRGEERGQKYEILLKSLDKVKFEAHFEHQGEIYTMTLQP